LAGGRLGPLAPGPGIGYSWESLVILML